MIDFRQYVNAYKFTWQVSRDQLKLIENKRVRSFVLLIMFKYCSVIVSAFSSQKYCSSRFFAIFLFHISIYNQKVDNF